MAFLGIKNPFRTGAGAATAAARDAATARQGRSSNLVRSIDQAFDDPRREQQIGDFTGALREQLGDTTNRGFADLSRGTKFATARAGLTGGRVDVDRQSRNLDELFRRRLSDEGQVQDAGNRLRTQDRTTRQSLIDAAYGAGDVGQAATRRMIGGQADNEAYLSSLLPSLVAGAGNGLAGAFSRRAEMGEYRRAMAPKWRYRGNLPSEVGGV